MRKYSEDKDAKKDPKCSVCASRQETWYWNNWRGSLEWPLELTVSSRSNIFKFCTASPSNFEDKFLDISN